MNIPSSVVEEIKVSYQPTSIPNISIKTSRDAYSVFIKQYDMNTIALQESFFIIYLNQQNMVKGIHRLSVGGISSVLVDIRLILSIALKSASTGIILSHNHPSGSLKPSQQDMNITEKIKSSCKLLDIKLFDHLIISPYDTYYSMADGGDLFDISSNKSDN